MTRPPPSTLHGLGKDRSSDAATESGTGSPASACSRALYSPFPGRSLHRDTSTVTTSAYSDWISTLGRHELYLKAIFITLLVAQLLVLRPLTSLVLVRVRVDGLVDRLCHLLLPALRYDQRKVLVQLLVTVQQLQDRQGEKWSWTSGL